MVINNIFIIIFLIFLFLSFIVKITLDIINYRHRKRNKDNIPNELKDLVDKEKLELINKYSNDKLRFSLVDYFFEKILLLVILFGGFIPLFYDVISARFSNIYVLGLLFFGGYYLLQTVLNIPFSLYFNFIIEKKYNFNKMTFGLWIGDLMKRIILSVIIGVIIIVPLLFFLYTFKNIWWVLLWGFFFVFSIIMQVIYPTLIAPLFNKFKPLQNEELKKKIEKLLSDSGFRSKGVFEMDASKRSSHSNAYFTGFGRSKRIVLFDSLLNNHSDEEILAVLAHEIGHFKLKHILKNLIFSTIISFISLFVAYLLLNNKLLYIGFGFSELIDIENIKFIGLFLLSIVIGPASFFFTPIGAIISRKHEYQADKFSVKMIGTSVPLIKALKKLNIDNLSNLYPADIYSWFYYSHPPLFKRIRVLKNINIKKS